ncbi:MAG: YerC/YecD family TrpR-related protein [Patescibacteria group bacterium]|nr:helix-turn-helix domain-containing protein [Patescibacteria group bacterium]
MQKSSKNNWEKELPNLHKAFLSLKTEAECKKFLRDLCTITEIQAMTERWQVVRMIDDGIPYREISKKTGMSTTTITRIADWMKNGEQGYQLVLKRMK